MTKIFISVLVLFGAMTAMADAPNDKAIYDALSVREMPMPTPYPMIGYQKAVGRLNCIHMINTKTNAESYSCSLQASSDDSFD